jgi:hypothetical protein
LKTGVGGRFQLLGCGQRVVVAADGMDFHAESDEGLEPL